jgi:hypothetical protein
MFLLASLSVAAVAQAEEPSVKVHVDADANGKGVALEKRSAQNAAWEHACDAPCDVKLPVTWEYRFAASGESPESKPFKLATKDGDKEITIKAELADKKKKDRGLYVLIGSAAVALGGIVVFIAGIHPSHTFADDGSTRDVNYNVATIGSLMLAGGVAGGIVGGSWYLGNSATQAGGAVKDIDAPSNKTGSVPAPTGVSFVLPLWSGTF